MVQIKKLQFQVHVDCISLRFFVMSGKTSKFGILVR